MKNDIDAILEAMFRNGKLNIKSRDNAAAEPKNEEKNVPVLTWDPAENTKKAADLVQSVENAANISEKIEKNVEQVMRETQSNMAELEQRLKQDGVENSTAKNSGNAGAVDVAFCKARAKIAEQIIGQDDFLDALTITFKRPFVLGTENDKPLCRAAIIGKNGTGRHTALALMTEQLGRLGVLKSPKLANVNLALYGEPGSEKLFFQDLYAALKSGASGVVFENFEHCHNSVLLMISQLFKSGSVALPGRYAEQKGILVNIGAALVPGAVSSLSAGGKYLFLLTDKSESQLGDAFGADFLSQLDDICKVNSFTHESLKRIAKTALDMIISKAVKLLNFTIAPTNGAVDALADSYNAEDGINAIVKASDEIYRALCEAKLKQGVESFSGTITAENGKLLVTGKANGVSLTIQASTDKGNSAKNAAVEAVKRELSEIVGLEGVKEYILSLEENFKVQQLRRERGLKAESPSMHMIFTGNPGTGKTTVARIVARYLKAIGVLSGGQLVEVTRADLVGKYVGHTAPLTAKVIQSALGGVLFIDEAYSLFRGKDDSFGLEAIDTLVKGMEDNRDNLLVILAGYSHEMEEFLAANSGLRSRFPNIIEFPDYSAEELFEITKSIAMCKGYTLDTKCKAILLDYYEKMQSLGDPRTNGNGRMARNKVEEAVLNCSRRCLRTPEHERNFELLLPEDFDLET